MKSLKLPSLDKLRMEPWKACVFAPASLKLSQAAGKRWHTWHADSRNFSHSSLPEIFVCGCKASQGQSDSSRLIKTSQTQGGSNELPQKALSLGASLIFAIGPSHAMPMPTHGQWAHDTASEAVLQQAVGTRYIEESLTSLARSLEARIDAAVGLISDFGLPLNRQEDADVAAQGKELITEVWEVIAKKYVDVRSGGFDQQKWAQLRDAALAKPLRDKVSVERAIRGMLAEGISDRFTRFISADQFAKMQSYDITGVGLNLCTASELEEKTDFHASQPGLYVLGLINHSPASQGGIAQGDQLLEVDGVSVSNETPFKAATLIQGPEEGPRSPTVSLKVRHGESNKVQQVSLQRPTIDTSSPVQSKLTSHSSRRIGHIRVEKFVARTQPDVTAAIVKLRDQGAEEFVLDLRDNLGGLVEEGVEVARLFLNGDVTIVNRLDRGGVRPKTAAGSHALTNAPLTVLVNERTASASEILAGALRDNCRAVLVGQRTYGKGLIQSVYQLEDGSALAVTIGKYLTPARTDIDREGIRPDFGSVPERSAAANILASCRIPQWTSRPV